MNIADTLRGFLRRWYIVVPGIILALVGAVGAYMVIQPGYERTATQLLLPGVGTVPKDVTNPYLYLGGLTQGSDIVVRVMQGEEVAGKVIAEYPGTEVLVQRDPTVSGPVIQIVVTAKTDAAAEGALAALVTESAVVLERLQDEQNVTDDDRMSISTVTADTSSTLQQKTRLVMSAGVALGLVVLTLTVASLVEGLSRRPRRGGRQATTAPATETPATETPDDDVEETQVDEVEPEFEELSLDLFAAIEEEDGDGEADREAVSVGAPSKGRRGQRGHSSRER